MIGWGRFWVLVGAGLLSSAACGGRTDMGEGYEEPGQGGTNGNPGPGLAGKGQACPGGSCAGRSPGSGAYPGYAGSVGGSGRAGAPGYGAYPGYGGGYPGTGGNGFGTAGSPPHGAGANTGGYYPYAGATSIPTAGSFGGPDVCSSCLFQSCGAELNQCFEDFGCLSIFSCAQARSCELYQCYTPDTCGAVIDQWGGPAGASMRLLLSAFTCSVRSGCPCN